MQNTTVEMIKSRIELLEARPKENQRIRNKLIRQIRMKEKESK